MTTTPTDIVERAFAQAWTDFLDCNPDDLNSPEELPDHALMTGAQFEQWGRQALEDVARELSDLLAKHGGRP
jgi:hypothetical protein